MGSKGKDQPAGDDAVTGGTASFFDDRAEEKARPVVPLRRNDDADAPTVVIRRTRGGMPRGPMLALIIGAAMAAGAFASYLSFRTATPATSAEATAFGASVPASSQPEPTPSRGTPGNASETSTGATRDTGRRDSPEVPVVPVNNARKEWEGRGRDEGERDEEKLAERARKEEERRREDEKKLAEREREEAKRRDERRRDEAKRDKPRARLVETFTEGPRP